MDGTVRTPGRDTGLHGRDSECALLDALVGDVHYLRLLVHERLDDGSVEFRTGDQLHPRYRFTIVRQNWHAEYFRVLRYAGQRSQKSVAHPPVSLSRFVIPASHQVGTSRRNKIQINLHVGIRLFNRTNVAARHREYRVLAVCSQPGLPSARQRCVRRRPYFSHLHISYRAHRLPVSQISFRGLLGQKSEGKYAQICPVGGSYKHRCESGDQ